MEKEELIQSVRSAQSGDSEALSALFDAYKNTAYSIALRETKDRTLSEDIVQETFIEVIRTIGTLKDPGAFPTWLKQLAYHQCTRHFKKKETKHEIQSAEAEDGWSVLENLEEQNVAYIPDAALDQKEIRAAILGMMDELPEVQSSALRMFYFDELPLKTIAEVQDVSLNTANTRLNRGRKAMREIVENYEEKNGIRLHVFAFLPFFKWLLADTMQEMPAQAAEAAAQGIAVKTGMKITAASAGSSAGAGAASAGIAGAGAKILGTPAAIKIIAGIAAVTVAVGSVAGYQLKSKNKAAPPAIVESVSMADSDLPQTVPIVTETTENTAALDGTAETLPLVSDAYYDHLTQNAYPGGESFFHIPKINADLPRIEETNAYIYNGLRNYLQRFVYDPMNQGELTALCQMSYIWGVKDQYLSILMSFMYGEPSCGAYTVSLETGALIDSSEILSAYGVSWEEFIEMVEAVNSTLDDDYLIDPTPYIDSQTGDLCVVGTFADRGWSWMFNLTGTSEPVYPWNNPETVPAS